MAKQKATVADGGTKLPAKKQKFPGKENQELGKKPKKTKNVENLQQNGTSEDAKVPAKKRKLDVKEESEETKEISSDKTTDTASINKNIFAVFNKLKDIKQKDIKKHLQNMLELLTTEANENKSLATSAYALKRLVRCTGADDLQAVALSGSYLCAILQKVPGIDPMALIDTLKRELPVGSQQKGKEESLAAVGQLITVLAIMKSQHFKKPSTALIAAIYPMLVAQLKGREYVMTMCADIMADSFKQVNAESFQSHVWPLLQPELNKPLTGLKLHSCDLLLAVHLNYGKLVSLKQLESSLWRKQPQYGQLFELYMNSASIQGNGLYARLGRFLATTNDGKLLNEWQQHIVEQLPLKHNTAKGYVIQTLSFVLLHFDDSKSASESPLTQLFASQPLMSMLLQELAAAKQLTDKSKIKAKPGQLQLRHICRRFEASLVLSFKRQLKQDSSKLAILQHLLQSQLQLDSVMQKPRLTQQLLGQLGEQGLQAMYKFYSEQFTSNKEELSKMHREHCLKYMQLLILNPQLTERKKQLQFLLPISICHLNEQQQPCNADQAAAFSRQGAARCEEILFGCLLHKIGNSSEQLEALVAQLRDTLQQLSKLLAQPQIETKLRSKQTPELLQAWKQVQQVANAPAKDKQSLTLVFHALILFLGLAMYAPSCNVSIELLNDLFICKQNALKKSKKAVVELGWQDVLTDVLLQLLLQTGHFWRDFVNKIGGALMPHLGKENLEQLLVILDMNKNPLGDKEGEQESDGEDEEEEQDEEQSSDDDDDDEDDEEVDDEDENENEAENDDDATNLELIRENVRKALLDEDNEQDNDASSVDWNDVDEAQGERLNMALERAFQAFKPKANNSHKSQQKHQTKSERINSTTLLHFRVRVLDLVELFVQAQPQLEVLLDALTSVYYVYQMSCNDNKLQPLAEASKKLLRKLLTQKISYQTPPEDKQPIVDCIQQFISQEQTPSTDQKPQQQQQQKSIKKKGDLAVWRNKCVAYLVSQFNEDDVTTSAVWPLLQDYLQDWITRRNSPHTLASFDAIFVSQWTGVTQLAINFASLLSKDLRNFRRNQILDLLTKHIGRIRNALANNASAAKEFTSLITKYVPIGPKDRNQQTKLLNQLKKGNN